MIDSTLLFSAIYQVQTSDFIHLFSVSHTESAQHKTQRVQ